MIARTFSRIYGLAASAWPGVRPDAVADVLNRVADPLTSGAWRRSRVWRRSPTERSSPVKAHNAQPRGGLSEELRGLGSPWRGFGNFVLPASRIPTPPTSPTGSSRPRDPRPDDGRLRPSRGAAHHRRGGRGTEAVVESSWRDLGTAGPIAPDTAPALRQDRAARHRPDRLLAGAWRRGAADWQAELVGDARSEKTRATALRLKLVDRVEADPAKAVAGADLVVLATPLGAYAELAQAMEKSLAPGAIVTDVGSVKQAVIRDVAPYIPAGVHFMPGHPIAGTEHTGPVGGVRGVVQRPLVHRHPAVPARSPQPSRRCGVRGGRCGQHVEVMDGRPSRQGAGHHLAFAASDRLHHCRHGDGFEESDVKRKSCEYAAGGFRDFTRIAASDPAMWRDVFLNNKEAVLEMLQPLHRGHDRAAARDPLGRGRVLEDHFRKTRAIRRGIIEAEQA